MNSVWKVIQAARIAETNTWCSTHVRISPSVRNPQQGPCDINRAKSDARTAFYFGAAANALIHRLESKFCKSFHAPNTSSKGKMMDHGMNLVEESTTDKHLIELMNDPDRSFARNFQNL